MPSSGSGERSIELGRGVPRIVLSMLIVDDVLATGETAAQSATLEEKLALVLRI